MAEKLRAEVEKALHHLEKLFLQFPDGATMKTLQDAWGEPIINRTLLRYLKILESRGQVRISGATRSRLYHYISGTSATPTKTVVPLVSGIPLSPESEAICHSLEQPMTSRTPVGYHAEFLQDYRPNIDYYLIVKQRIRLLTLGQTAQGDQPAGTYARQIMQRLLIDLSYNSSRLEGNTYSLLDTERLLDQGQAASDKSAKEAQMILNHKEAIEFLVDSAGEIGFNRYTITNLHALLSNNLLPNPAASGRLRTHAIGIHGSVYTPLDMPQRIEEYFQVFLQKADAITDPFEQAFFAMVHLPYLQPFDDVNKRVSRLAANIPLNKANLAPLSFVEVPQDLYIKGLLGVYEQQNVTLLRDVFLWAYEKSCERYAAMRQTLGDPDAFRMKYREEIRGLVTAIVSEAVDHQAAQQQIDARAGQLPEADRARFSEVVGTELQSLHPGNIARYRIRPAQFDAWLKVWSRLQK